MYVWIGGVSSEGYDYQILALDNNSGVAAYESYWSPCIIQIAWTAAFEVGNGAISSCANVPYKYVNFTNISLWEANPYWDSYNPVSISESNQILIGEPNQDPNCGFNLGVGFEGSTYGWVTTLWQ
jgi:hypothetical protein